MALGNTLVATPGRALAGLGLIALGLPIYVWSCRRALAQSETEWFTTAG